MAEEIADAGDANLRPHPSRQLHQRQARLSDAPIPVHPAGLLGDEVAWWACLPTPSLNTRLCSIHQLGQRINRLLRFFDSAKLGDQFLRFLQQSDGDCVFGQGGSGGNRFGGWSSGGSGFRMLLGGEN